MSSQSNGQSTPTASGESETSLLAGFGPNEWIVEDMYQRYLSDPSSVDPAWHDFFADYKPASDAGTTASGSTDSTTATSGSKERTAASGSMDSPAASGSKDSPAASGSNGTAAAGSSNGTAGAHGGTAVASAPTSPAPAG
ncbi:2-oxoglutarate dehydrogenase E1 subunit family protein, partial [Actinocatenispora comari]|uniref:2-oxoglutarate dehydrogenase E1 subunit family protein n=1 Tax=Actinocatenispora comari TaxID=2807577 RepID=UPI003F7ED4B1